MRRPLRGALQTWLKLQVHGESFLPDNLNNNNNEYATSNRGNSRLWGYDKAKAEMMKTTYARSFVPVSELIF